MNKDHQLEHLIRMANQIADNYPASGNDEAEKAALVANHLRRFWARSMRDQIATYAQEDGSELNAVALAAILQLKPTQNGRSNLLFPVSN